jgi:glycosyltransferase involved in cell wall biosynthesis
MNPAAAQRFDQQRFDQQTDPVPGPTQSAARAVRVAFDATPLLGPRTGIGVLVAALARRLAVDETVDLTGYVVSWRAGDYRAALPGGCGALRMRLPARVCHRLWRHVDRPRLSRGFDVVHGTNYVVPPPRGTDAVSLVSVHDLTPWRYPELVDRYSRANPRLLQRALDRGAHIHTGAHAVAEEIRTELGVDPDRVHVVVNGFDRNPPGDGVSGRSLIGAPYVLAIGTIEPRKDYVGLLGAMTEVWAVHPGVRVAIVGGDGWGVDEFNQTVRRLGVGERLVRCGYVSQQTKADLIAGAELLAYPSVYEGFGLPVLEAMDAGLPVVSTRVPAIAEVAGDAAVLVPSRSPTDLAQGIIGVLDDDQLRADLRRRGRLRSGRFSWDTAAAELADLYRRLALPG